MNCKDCIKWLENLKSDLGKSQFSELWHYEQALVETIELLQSDRFVELPCEIGDKVYYLSIKSAIPLTYKIVDGEVLDYNINRYGIFDVKIRQLNSDYIFRTSIDKIFLSKDEAEVRLKELNNETT